MFLFKSIGGIYREYRGIKMIAQPKDTTLYRSLLPEKFSIPEQPSVFIFIADYLKVALWPFKILPWNITRYQEGGVFLWSNYQGEEGWFCLNMPISNWLGMAQGRYFLGFPKYVAEKISLEEDNENWHGWVKHKDKLKLNLNFTAGIKRTLALWEEQILDNEAFFEDSSYLLFPAERGPTVNKVWMEEVTQPKWSPVLGMVQITVDPDDPWADLIATGTAYPGMYNYFVGGNSLMSEKFS